MRAETPRRIAVFRALQLGDLLCAVPALRAMRAAWPRARICLIGLPWAADFVSRMPYIDDFIEFPGFPGMPERTPDLAAWPAYLAEVRKRDFDLAIQMHGCGVLTNALVAAMQASRSAGFFLPGREGPQPEIAVPWPQDLPEVRRLLLLTESIGAPSRGEHLELPILPGEAAAWVALREELALDAEGAPHGYICVHPGARLATRRWPPERFAAVADELAEAGYRIVLTGTMGEGALTAQVAASMAAEADDLAGRTELGTLAALVAQAELVICNDTGISHVAAAMCTPSVVVCCGADAARWQPLDGGRHQVLWHPVGCRPCAYDACPTDHECATAISASDVVREAFSLLALFGESGREPA
ncbi:MAG TPA: glycosyltransferase family 9 protein [Rhodocyclaceae bacterium]